MFKLLNAENASQTTTGNDIDKYSYSKIKITKVIKCLDIYITSGL